VTRCISPEITNRASLTGAAGYGEKEDGDIKGKLRKMPYARDLGEIKHGTPKRKGMPISKM